MKRLLIVISFVAALSLTSLSLAADNSAEKLKVGMILALSGDGASLGEAVRDGATLAYNKLPQNVRDRIDLHYEDDALNPMSSVTAFKKLTTMSGAKVIVSVSSGTSKALAPLAEQQRVPLIAVGASDPKIVKNRNYAMNFWVTPDQEANVMLPEMVKRGYKKVARIGTIQEGLMSMNAAFDRINNGTIDIALSEEFAPDVKDFKTYIAKFRQLNDVDAIMVSLMPGQLGIFGKQFRQMGCKQPMFGFEIFEDINEVKASDGALIGAWYVNGADSGKSFVTEYKTAFPNGSLFAAANGYDAILLLGKAVETSTNPEDVNRFLHTVKDFSGALGTYSASGDNRFTLPAAVKVVTKDGFETLTQ